MKSRLDQFLVDLIYNCKKSINNNTNINMRNVSNTHFSILSLAITLLLDEINTYPTTLCEFNDLNQ